LVILVIMGNINMKPIHPDLRDWLHFKKIPASEHKNIQKSIEIICNKINGDTFHILGKKFKIEISDLPNHEEDAKFWDEIERFPA